MSPTPVNSASRRQQLLKRCRNTFVAAFSLPKNAGRIFAPRPGGVSSPIACFDGIRTLSMLWIMLG